MIKQSALIAKAISLIFNPVLLVIIALSIANIGWVSTNILTSSLLLLGLLLALALVLIISRKNKKLNFLINPPRSDRDKVYLNLIICLLLGVVASFLLNLNLVANHLILGFIITSFLYLINHFVDKVSVHITFFVFSVFYLLDKIDLKFSLCLLLLPIIIWARIKLHKHTWLQIFLGLFVGAFVGTLSWTL